MTVLLLPPAAEDLQEIYDYYESCRAGLGDRMLDEFRRGVEHILERPNAWQSIDDTFRQYRLKRFPYGIIYHISHSTNEIVIVTVTHLSREPGWWRDRT